LPAIRADNASDNYPSQPTNDSHGWQERGELWLGATKIDGAKPTRTPLRRGSKPHEQPQINQN
jgi:hypothetical protein